MKQAKQKGGTRVSAGLLMYRINDGRLEVFLAHPGGPYFANKDDGHWTIPKGEIHPGEDLLDAAIREFTEEVGLPPSGGYLPLGSIRQKGGKVVHGWAFQGHWEEGRLHQCNNFNMEWPPNSGKFVNVPEVDRVGFFTLSQARRKLKDTQYPFLDRLAQALGLPPGSHP